VVALVLAANFAAIIAVLLPNQIAHIDPPNKVQNLAIVTSVSFGFTLFAQPLVGALSDRTRGTLGRRLPWMAAGAVVAAAFLFALGGIGSVLWVCVFWVVIQFALNAVDGPVSAVVPDRIPRSRRGTASAIIGIGMMAGAALGTVGAAEFAHQLPLAYTALGIAVIAGVAVFAVFGREPAEIALARQASVPPFSWRGFLRGFWVDPRQHPDFTWAFAARFLFILGYNLVYSFQLFVLTDYIGMSLDDANRLLGLLTVLTFITTLLAVVVAGWWSDRSGRRKIFVGAASAFLVIALAAPLLVPTVGGMVVFAAVKGLGFGIFLSSAAALFTEVLPHDGGSAAKDLGIFNVATNLAQVLAPAIAAAIIGSTVGYPALFGTGIVAVIAAALLILPIRGVR
jgi:MFS family permease